MRTETGANSTGRLLYLACQRSGQFAPPPVS